MGSMRPSEVRSRILRDHEVLGERLAALQRLADEAAEGSNGEACARTREFACGVVEELADHLEVEEQLLVPVLRDMDAWGPLRADELRHHHEQQWRGLKRLRERVSAPALQPPELAAHIALMVQLLRHELQQEAHELLTPELLRDDILGIDVEDG
jgi:iron-sulfur cluster repair protein YtfE (RIC family)